MTREGRANPPEGRSGLQVEFVQSEIGAICQTMPLGTGSLLSAGCYQKKGGVAQQRRDERLFE